MPTDGGGDGDGAGERSWTIYFIIALSTILAINKVIHGIPIHLTYRFYDDHKNRLSGGLGHP